MQILYTKRQLAALFKPLTDDSVAKMLRGVPPDGTNGRWPAWTEETFKKAKDAYYSKVKDETDMESAIDDTDHESPLGMQIQEADLRVKTARAEALELDNQERRNSLVSRKEVEDLTRFIFELFADKFRQHCRDKGDDLYNLVIEEITKEIELYVTEKSIDNIVDDKEFSIIRDAVKPQIEYVII